MVKKIIIKFIVVSCILLFASSTNFAQETTKAPNENVKEPWFLYWKTEVKDIKEILEEKRALEKKYVDLLAKYNNETQALKEENDRLKNANRQLEQEKQDRVSSRTVTVSDSETKIANLERELAETKRQKEQLERELASKSNAERQAQERIKTLEATISANNAQKNNLSSSYTSSSTSEELKSQVSNLTTERDQLQRDLAASYNQIDTLKRNQSTSGSTYADPNADVRLKDSEMKARDLQTRLNQISSERDSLQTQIFSLKSGTGTTTSNSTATDKDKKITDLEAQVNSLTNQRDQLQRDIAAIYGYQKSIVIGNQVNPSSISNNSSTTSSTPEDTSAAIARANRLEVELAEMTKKRDKLQKDLDSSYSTTYNSNKNPYNTSTTTTTTTITEETQTRIAALEKENKELVLERNQLKMDLAKSLKDDSISKNVSETKTTITTIESKMTDAEKAKETAVKEAAKDITRIDSAKQATDSKIAANEKELDQRKMNLDELKKEIETLSKEISELKEDKETLETDLAATKEMHQEENSKNKEEIERLTLQAQKLEEALEKELKRKKPTSSKEVKTTKTTKSPKTKIKTETERETETTVSTTETEESSTSAEPAKVSSKSGKTIISLASKVNFKSGSNELTPKGKETLNSILKVLRKYSSDRIYVEGNTDNRPINENSKFKDNWHLSFERALTVLKYLNKDKSLKNTKFAAAAYAEKNPIKPNTTEPNLAANRRVDIVVVPRK